ncbi:MAG: DUF1634 domain-containing protein [Bacteroidaceae bacterium]|nr:DUF1634 domain-containing protein [Bacteroidaceae bacterium]
MKDLRNTIGNTLRYGVLTACLVTLVGGAVYMFQHGGDPAPDYSRFAGRIASYTTPAGIFGGFFRFSAYGLIQVGVIALLLTPIMRVVLSLIDFVQQRDWLYAAITSLVLAVIFVNSIASPM